MAEPGERTRRQRLFAVLVERQEGLWRIRVPDVNGYAQVRTLRGAPDVARDLITQVTGRSGDNFGLELEWVLPTEVQGHLEAAQRLRQEEERANTAAANEVRLAAKGMAAAGMSVRDIGTVLGVSHQRAHQFLGARQSQAGRTGR